jgi:hypothetical protein
MNWIKKLFFIGFVFCAFQLNAQKWSFLQHPDLDSAYIRSYIERLVVRPNINQKSSDFRIFDVSSGSLAEFTPNAAFGVGLGFTYKWVGVGVSLNLPFTTLNADKYGRTQNYDLQAFIFPRKFFGDVNLQYYNGYYLGNYKGLLPQGENAENISRGDVTTINASASLLYVFNNEKYSFRSVFTQNERQLKSAGSWLAGVTLSIYQMQADSNLIPFDVLPLFREESWLSNSSAFTVSLKFGYAHSWVFGKKKDIVASVFATPGIGSTRIYSELENERQIENRPTLSIKGAAALSKFWKTNTIGIYAISEELIYDQGSRVAFSYNKGLFRLFYARRVGAPKVLSKVIK